MVRNTIRLANLVIALVLMAFSQLDKGNATTYLLTAILSVLVLSDLAR